MCQELEPDVLLLDLSMPGPPADETVTYLREHCPNKVLMLTAYSDEAHVRKLVTAGVAGYVLKDEATEMVVQAVRAVMQGGTWFSKPIVEKLSRLASGKAPLDEKYALTKRELEVLNLVAKGYTNIQIGETLSISERTVRFHMEKILAKLGVSNRTQTVAVATQRGWIEPAG